MEKLPESYKYAVKSAAEELLNDQLTMRTMKRMKLKLEENLKAKVWIVGDFSASDQRAFLDAAAETWKEAANDAGGDALNNRAKF